MCIRDSLAGGHQQDPFEAELERRLLSQHEMADMGRVEGATEYAQAGNAYPRTCPLPRTTYLVVVSSRSPIGPRA